MKRILFVADISNLYYTVAKRFGGKKLDYRFLLNKIVGDSLAIRAIAYGAEIKNEASAFKEFLRSIGFEIKYKSPSEFKTDIPGLLDRKADWDVGIAMDVVSMVDSVDIVVFGTADGDMAPCLEYVKSKGKLAFVIGSGISRHLKEVATDFIEITPEYLES